MGLASYFGRMFGRSTTPLSWNQYLDYFKYGGHFYPFVPATTLGSKEEPPVASFEGYTQAGYKANGVIFACMLARLHLFTEARFQFRQVRSGRPGKFFSTPALGILEKPWPSATTGDLLARAIQDVDLAGNFYCARRGNRIRRMRPDWVTIVMGSELDGEDAAQDLDAEVIGYVYKPGGQYTSANEVFLTPDEVCHFAPIPDPSARFRGMSWLTPIIPELMADSAATDHKLRFFQNGATPNMVVSTAAPMSPDAFNEWVKNMQDSTEGSLNAYKTLYLGAGATAEVVGSDFRQIDFKVTQGAGETRIAAAAGVPPIVVGLSEGLESATYSNYGQARRRFADLTMRPLWRNMAGSMSNIVEVPPNAELWYDDRDIPALQEDAKDAAEVLQTNAATISSLVNAGYEADSVKAAVISGDFSQLKHTGLFSVQLQPPMPDGPPELNANGNGAPVPLEAG